MAGLAEALNEYEQAISDLGFDVYSTVRPGLERSVIVGHLEEAGLEPIDDVVDWFAFSNGLRPFAEGQVRLTGVFDGVMAVSLDEALTERQSRLDPDFLLKHGLDETQVRELAEADLLVPFEPSWMPISHGKQTCVIETNRAAERFGQLIALWSDELYPRIKATSMTEWVRRFTASVDSGTVKQYTPSNVWAIAGTHYELGDVDMSERDVKMLEISAKPERLRGRCSTLRLQHAVVGSLAGNRGLEEAQARHLEQVLRSMGFDDFTFEYEAIPPRYHHLHAIEIMGVADWSSLDPEGAG